jgi:ribonuclease Z
MRRRLFYAVGILLSLLALGFLSLRIPAVEDRAMDWLFARATRVAANELFADDALRVFFCGTGSPLPHPTRAAACVAVFAGGRFYLVDTGPRSWNKLALARVDGSRIGGVFFTHFHSDHIGELGEVDLQTWAAGRPEPLAVFGPPGVERLVAGFEEAYALDTRYRIAHHGADFLSETAGRMEAHPIVGPDTGVATVALERDGLVVTAFAVDHAPIYPAYGYRFDWRGRSVAVSGDTVKSASLIAAARGVDVLAHEAQANHLIARIGEVAAKGGRPRAAKIMADIPSYHTTPVEAAQVANEAGARLLVLYHLNPPPPLPIVERVFVRGVAEARKGDWMAADDGLLLELPADSTEIRVRTLD